NNKHENGMFRSNKRNDLYALAQRILKNNETERRVKESAKLVDIISFEHELMEMVKLIPTYEEVLARTKASPHVSMSISEPIEIYSKKQRHTTFTPPTMSSNPAQHNEFIVLPRKNKSI